MKNVVVTIDGYFDSAAGILATRLADEFSIPRYCLPDIVRYAIEQHILNPEKDHIDTEVFYDSLTKAICHMATQQSFVLEHHAAAYVLRDFPNVISIHLTAPYEYIADKVEELETVEKNRAIKILKNREEVQREEFLLYANAEWNNMDFYDFSLNSSMMNVDEMFALICDYYKMKVAEKD